MTAWDPDAWTRNMIADLRANGGTPSSGPLVGRPLAIMTSKGAKTGQDRTAIVTYHRDGDDVRHRRHEGRRRRAPRLVPQPRRASRGDVRSRQRQLPGRRARNDGRRAPAAATTSTLGLYPEFAAYPSKTSRVIPVFVLEQRAG